MPPGTILQNFEELEYLGSEPVRIYTILGVGSSIYLPPKIFKFRNFYAARYTRLSLASGKVKFGASDLNLLNTRQKVFKSAERVTESNDASAPASPVQQPTEPTAPALTATLTASSEAATPRPSACKATIHNSPTGLRRQFFDPKKENWLALETWKPILFLYKLWLLTIVMRIILGFKDIKIYLT
ncbi:hypothetical protein L209DRAFT_746221 [Thermothelomyces heterothallicus CBS 203.75]